MRKTKKHQKDGGAGGGGGGAGQSAPGNSFLASVRYTASWQPSVSPCQCL